MRGLVRENGGNAERRKKREGRNQSINLRKFSKGRDKKHKKT